MRIDETDDFFRCMSRDEVWFECRGREFLVNGCQCEFDRIGRTVKSTLELYALNEDGCVADILYRISADSPVACIKSFVREARIFGKPFVEMRKFIRWRK